MSLAENNAATIVTGGGHGIGRVIAEKLAATTNIVIVGRNGTALTETCNAINNAQGKAEFVAGDVSDPSTSLKTMNRIKELGWQLQNVICNAGIGKSSPTHELSDEQWQSTIDTNLNGSFYFVRAALPIFIEQKSGTFCFISSIAGVKADAYEAVYTASKHAVVGLSKTIALEYGKHGIVSVPICPSFIAGDMTDRSIASLAARRGISSEEARSVIEKVNPQNRIIPPDEVAELVAFICSGKAPSLSGNPIIMSGGE